MRHSLNYAGILLFRIPLNAAWKTAPAFNLHHLPNGVTLAIELPANGNR